MYILNIETSTSVCSVALSKGNELIAKKESYEQNSHSKILATFIENILSENKVLPSDLNAIAVSEGPGSYTGLRIGASTAKGLAYSLSIPMIAIDTLQIMTIEAIKKSSELKDEDSIFCPMIDARRMEVYTAFYDKKANKISETSNVIIDKHSYLTPLHRKKIIFFGNGSAKCKDVITHENAIFIDNIFPLAENMAEIVFRKFQTNDFVDVAYFEPFYLKPFIATTPKNKLV